MSRTRDRHFEELHRNFTQYGANRELIVTSSVPSADRIQSRRGAVLVVLAGNGSSLATLVLSKPQASSPGSRMMVMIALCGKSTV